MDSVYHRPEDLVDVPVSVGDHSGSHYAAIQALEPFIDRARVKLSFSGLPNDRVRLLVRGEVPVANLFGAQYYIAEQFGFRKIVDSTFMVGFLVAPNADLDETKRYFRALQSAQREIDLQPDRYKKYWLREMPEDLARAPSAHRLAGLDQWGTEMPSHVDTVGRPAHVVGARAESAAPG
jgi:NitT/TauT family transport system substrate-binding protein